MQINTQIFAAKAQNKTHYLHLAVRTVSKEAAATLFQRSLDIENSVLKSDGGIDDPYVLGDVVMDSVGNETEQSLWAELTKGCDTESLKISGIIVVPRAGMLNEDQNAPDEGFSKQPGFEDNADVVVDGVVKADCPVEFGIKMVETVVSVFNKFESDTRLAESRLLLHQVLTRLRMEQRRTYS